MAGNLKEMLKERFLDEVLRPVTDEWSVLLMDSTTIPVVSSFLRTADMLDYGVTLVEDVGSRREPLPEMAGVYFITPSKDSVASLMEDFSDEPLYASGHVFFSSPAPQNVLAAIRSSPHLTSRLKTLKEVNLEFQVRDERTYVTGEEDILQALLREKSSESPSYKLAVATLSSRLSGVFASLKEFPSIRVCKSKPVGDEPGPQIQVSKDVGMELIDRLRQYQRAKQLPSTPTCDLIIAHRGLDAVASVIHEWTYEAMAYDLLGLKGSTFKYESMTAGGKKEIKEHILDEQDELWVEFRHQPIGAVKARLAALLEGYRALLGPGSLSSNSAPDMSSMKSLAEILPQKRGELAKLYVHMEMASRIQSVIDERALQQLGTLEQDLVYGDAGPPEVMSFLVEKGAYCTPADKARLLMCYVATHPETMDEATQRQWQELARLEEAEMRTIINLECLGVPVRKHAKPYGLYFACKCKRTLPEEQAEGEDEEVFNVSRFRPVLQNVLKDVIRNSLSEQEVPYLVAPDSHGDGRGAASTASMTRRVFVFVIGGITYSEVRAAHIMSAKLNRDIIIGGTTLDAPSDFLEHVKGISNQREHFVLEVEKSC